MKRKPVITKISRHVSGLTHVENEVLGKKTTRQGPHLDGFIGLEWLHRASLGLASLESSLNEYQLKKSNGIFCIDMRAYRKSAFMRARAILDFGNWHNMTELPWIRHKSEVDRVHILHELIHLEKFFVNEYPLIACNNTDLHPVMDVFKNIPEDFVAHKIIRDVHGYNPIDETWFEGKNNLGFPRKLLAAYLIQYHLFSEFCPEYLDLDNDFQKLVKENNHDAYRMAVESWEALEEMDIRDKDSYDACADEIIKVFAPEHYGIPPQPYRIYTASVRKNPQGLWEFNR